jgi:hypothetical protein
VTAWFHVLSAEANRRWTEPMLGNRRAGTVRVDGEIRVAASGHDWELALD